MLDIFISIFSDRGPIQSRVLAHWRQIAHDYRANLKILVPDLLHKDEARAVMERIAPFSIEVMQGPLSEFQRQRRILAEGLSKTRWYVVADDDCLLDQEDAIPMAMEALFGPEHESFAVVAPLPSNANISLWTPENYLPVMTDDVIEHVNVGGIRFCRKGVMPSDPDKWRPQPEKTDWGWKFDREHGEQIRERGYRMGFFRNVTMKHLGERRPVTNTLLMVQ